MENHYSDIDSDGNFDGNSDLVSDSVTLPDLACPKCGCVITITLSPATYRGRVCEMCGNSIARGMFCSAGCRQKAYRQRKAQARATSA